MKFNWVQALLGLWLISCGLFIVGVYFGAIDPLSDAFMLIGKIIVLALIVAIFVVGAALIFIPIHEWLKAKSKKILEEQK